MEKAKKLRGLFESGKLIRLVGAHNGITAKLVEKAGFEGVWASSLEVSASHAVPDANILTMTDYLNAAISMNDAISIPVIVDVDQGYGNSSNVIRMVNKFEAAGIAGIIMEDKLFPKQNSLLEDGRQELASIAEFVGKIMAAKNAQKTKDFMVMARVEALIAGWGQEEAMKRAKAYANAGADAIMIHSKKDTPDEILEFVKKWKENIPIVIVPTNYHTFTENKIREYPQIKMVIYANHVIRSAVTAIKETLNEIGKTGGINTVTPKIVPIKEVFKLQGTTELKEHEKKFLKNAYDDIKTVILAAGPPKSESLNSILKDVPLIMLDINGKNILQRNLECLKSIGIKNNYVVLGHGKEKFNLEEGISIIQNNEYETTGPLHSFMQAKKLFDNKVLMIFGDIIFDKKIIDSLIKKNKDISLVIDASYKDASIKDKVRDLVKAKLDAPEGRRAILHERKNPLVKTSNVPKEEATHEFVGIAFFSEEGIKKLKEEYEKVKSSDGKILDGILLEKADFIDMTQHMINKGYEVSSEEINKGWTEIHSFDDYKKACEQLK